MARIRLPRQVGIVAADARKAQGFTQLEIARAAGVSRQLVNRLETGAATGIALDKLMAILDAVGCALEVYPTNADKPTTQSFDAQTPPVATETFDPSEAYPLDGSLFDPPPSEG